MENFIIYLFVALFVLFNIFRTYKKESSKNKERMMNQPRPRLVPDKTNLSTQETSPVPPFSRRTLVPVEESEVATLETIIPEITTNLEAIPSSYVSTLEEPVLENKKRKKERYTEIQIEEPNVIDLQLRTKEDLRRAFIHSIIFERKY